MSKLFNSALDIPKIGFDSTDTIFYFSEWRRSWRVASLQHAGRYWKKLQQLRVFASGCRPAYIVKGSRGLRPVLGPMPGRDTTACACQFSKPKLRGSALGPSSVQFQVPEGVFHIFGKKSVL